MTPPSFFLYGTLRDPDILVAVLGRTVLPDALLPGAAPDCAAVYYPDRLYPALVRRAGAIAPGLVFTGATVPDMDALDAFEGDEYRRDTLTVTTAAGETTAHAYWPTVAVPLSAPDWTLEGWTRDHKPQVLSRETALARAARLGLSQR